MSLKKYSLLFAMSLFVVSCDPTTKFSSKEDEISGKSKKLEIDGLYDMRFDVSEKLEAVFGIIGTHNYVRLEKGVAYYEKGNTYNVTPGKVFMKNIKKVKESRYKAEYWLTKDSVINVTILVDGNNLRMTMPTAGWTKIRPKVTFEFIEE